MSTAAHYWNESASFNQFQAYFTQFLESLPLGLIWLDQKGQIKKQNQLSKVFLGFEGVMVGQLWRDVINACVVPQSKPGFEVLVKNGRRLDVSTQAVPSLENPQQLEQIILLSDVTETRRLQQQVDQEDRLRELGALSATLSHQLRTPLSTCLLYADQLRHYELPAQRRKTVCDTMANQLNYMNRQVNDLLFFVKGDLPVEESQTVGDILNAVLQMSKSAIKNMHPVIQCDTDIAIQHIQCHYDALIGALSNIVTNACEASKPGAVVRIAVRRMQCQQSGRGFFYFDIFDEGCGFSDKAQDNFGKKAFSTKKSGSGIGLRFASTVANKHGGRLLLSPQKQGSCVSISVPFMNS